MIDDEEIEGEDLLGDGVPLLGDEDGDVGIVGDEDDLLDEDGLPPGMRLEEEDSF